MYKLINGELVELSKGEAKKREAEQKKNQGKGQLKKEQRANAVFNDVKTRALISAISEVMAENINDKTKLEIQDRILEVAKNDIKR